MNLIEQLGGYEKAKNIFISNEDGYNFYSIYYEYYSDNHTYEDSINIVNIEEKLLEYRRDNNIFEVGDIVAEPNLTYPYLYKIYEISGLLIKVENLTNNRKSISFGSDIRHATEEELKAGHRL